MKIELQHEELNDAIALYLEKRMFPGQQFTVNVNRCNGLTHGEKPARYTIVAEASASPDEKGQT